MKIKEGEVIIFPTDTVYGMGARLFDNIGQNRIMQIKKRSSNKRLAVLCANLQQIEDIAVLNEKTRKIILKYLPGGLTLVLKAKSAERNWAISETIGVRIPNHPLAIAILEENGPMATTSVNLSSEKPLNNYEEIVKEFGALVDCVYRDPYKIGYSNISSTVLDMTSDDIIVLREGKITLKEIEEYLEKYV